MRLTDYLLSAQANLRRTKVRTTLTVTAIVVGTLTLAMTTAFGQGLQAYINTQLGAYGAQNVVQVGLSANERQQSSAGVLQYDSSAHTGSVYFSQSDLTTIQTTPGVAAAYADYTNVSPSYVQYGSGAEYQIGVQPAFPGDVTNLAAGHFPGVNEQHAIVLPFPYVATFGLQSPADLVGKQVTVHLMDSAKVGRDYTFSVAGVLPDTLHTPGAFVSYQDIDAMSQAQYGANAQYDQIVAIMKDGTTAQDRAAARSHIVAAGFVANTYEDTISHFQRPLAIVQLGLDGFAGLTLLAATIGIVNTLLMAVLERTQEIGLLKAVGMRRRSILAMFLIEAMSIGFWGGVIGVGLGIALGTVANKVLLNTIFVGFPGKQILTFPLPAMLGIIGLGMLLGFIAGVIPAWRASRLEPIDAMRHE
jgi:putative ABC transport system permease protein